MESADLAVISKIREEYDSIFDSLMEYLNDEMGNINSEIEKDTSTVLRSWEGVRVSGIQVGNVVNGGRGLKECKGSSSFEDIRKKWGVKM